MVVRVLTEEEYKRAAEPPLSTLSHPRNSHASNVWNTPEKVTAAPDVGVGVQDWSALRPHRYSASYMAKILRKRTNWTGQNHGLERLKMAFPKMEILDHVGHLRLNSCIGGVGIDVGDVLVDDGLE